MKEEPSAFFTYVVTYHIFQEVHMVKGHAFFYWYMQNSSVVHHSFYVF